MQEFLKSLFNPTRALHISRARHRRATSNKSTSLFHFLPFLAFKRLENNENNVKISAPFLPEFLVCIWINF
jgi:hypothetical protein